MAKHISFEKFKKLHDEKNVNLIDVRTPAEYNAKHVKGSFNVPLDRLPEHKDSLKHSKRNVVFVCKSGKRSEKACEIVKTMGIEDSHALDEGVDDLEFHGMEVIIGLKKWELERQVRLLAGSIVLMGVILGFTFNIYFTLVSGFIGLGLVFAAITNTCGMAMLLAKLPYNKN